MDTCTVIGKCIHSSVIVLPLLPCYITSARNLPCILYFPIWFPFIVYKFTFTKFSEYSDHFLLNYGVGSFCSPKVN